MEYNTRLTLVELKKLSRQKGFTAMSFREIARRVGANNPQTIIYLLLKYFAGDKKKMDNIAEQCCDRPMIYRICLPPTDILFDGDKHKIVNLEKRMCVNCGMVKIFDIDRNKNDKLIKKHNKSLKK